MSYKKNALVILILGLFYSIAGQAQTVETKYLPFTWESGTIRETKIPFDGGTLINYDVLGTVNVQGRYLPKNATSFQLQGSFKALTAASTPDCLKAFENSTNPISLQGNPVKSINLKGDNKFTAVISYGQFNAFGKNKYLPANTPVITKCLESSVAATSAAQVTETSAPDHPVEACTKDNPCTTLFNYHENQVTITDPMGHKTLNKYTSYGNPDNKYLYWTARETVKMAGTDVDITTHIIRDVMGRIQEVDQGENSMQALGYKRHYQYDSHYFLIGEDNPETGHTTYKRDAIGEMTSKQVGSSKPVTYSYDSLGQLSQVKYPQSDLNFDVTYTYDPDGHVTSVANSNHGSSSKWAYQYDANGNLAEADLSQTGVDTYLPNNPAIPTLKFKYNYDALDHLSGMTYPDGTYLNFNPNALGQPTVVGGSVAGVQYYPNGKIQSFNDSNGVVTQYALNDRQMDNNIQAGFSGEQPFLKRHYTYDGVGNITAIDDGNPAHSQTFGYNSVYWLTHETIGTQATTIGYDAIGNIIGISGARGNLTYQYDKNTNRLASVSGSVNEALTYDAYGDITSNKTGNTFVYNDAQELKQATGSNPITGKTYDYTYCYDGNNNRIQVVGNHDSTIFYLEVYNRKHQLLYQEDLKNNQATDYLYLLGHKVGKAVHPINRAGLAQDVTFLHDDLLGSPLQETTVDKKLKFSQGQLYWGYGKEYLDTTKDRPTDHVGFTGKLHDDDTGFSYYGARYYDPVLGRFLSVDPVGFKPANPVSFNRYAYANDNPLKYKDPDGRYPATPAVSGVEVAIGAITGGITGYAQDGAKGAIVGAVVGAVTAFASNPLGAKAAAKAAAVGLKEAGQAVAKESTQVTVSTVGSLTQNKVNTGKFHVKAAVIGGYVGKAVGKHMNPENAPLDTAGTIVTSINKTVVTKTTNYTISTLSKNQNDSNSLDSSSTEHNSSDHSGGGHGSGGEHSMGGDGGGSSGDAGSGSGGSGDHL